MDFSLNRLFARTSEAQIRVITIYTRDGCGCCRKAKEVLGGFSRKYRFQVEEIDVDASQELKERYGLEVPVVAVDGRVRFRGSVNSTMLERLLRSGGSEDAGIDH